jgi:glycosyltransferase involved in cell wall biosynthesis
MHVCHLIKGLGRGGAEMLLPWLVEHGRDHATFSVGFFVPWKDQLAAASARAGARVHCFEAGSALALMLRVGAVHRWLRDEGADVLHCHLPLAGVVGRLAASMSGTPVVYTEHNLLERYHAATRRAELATWRMQRMVIAVSQEVATSIARYVDGTVPVRVIRNGIPVHDDVATPAARAETRSRLGFGAGAPVVGTVAVMRTQKRLDLWLAAAAEIRRSIPEARFLLVGDGPERVAVQQRADSLGLSGAVVFAGLQPAVQPFLEAMDVFLLSSEFEGLPIALLEAMAAGVPVVATTVGGVPEVVVEGGTGRLVAFGDAQGLASASVALLLDPEGRVAMGNAARERVRREFGIARMAAELAQLYNEVAEQRVVSS